MPDITATCDEVPDRGLQQVIIRQILQGIGGEHEMAVASETSMDRIPRMDNVHMPAEIRELLVPTQEVHPVTAASIPTVATSGRTGARNGRGRSGCFTRNRQAAANSSRYMSR